MKYAPDDIWWPPQSPTGVCLFDLNACCKEPQYMNVRQFTERISARRNVVPTLSPQLHRAILFEGAMERAISAKTPENIATRVPVYSSAPSIESGRRTFVDPAQFAAGSQDC
jgi:hypothetical protein